MLVRATNRPSEAGPRRYAEERASRPRRWSVWPALTGMLVLVVLLVNPTQSFAQDSNIGDNLLYQAIVAEENDNLEQARDLYQLYLDDADNLTDRQTVLIRVSVLNEVLRNGNDTTAALFLDALSALEYSDLDAAVSQLIQIDQQYRNSYLHDDALYLLGYIHMMEMYAYEKAHSFYQRLRLEYPESNYRDTALYSEAIVLEQMGNTLAAENLLIELRDRHSRSTLGLLGISLPQDNLLSRLWFNRADRRLRIIARQQENAAVLTQQTITNQQSGQLTANVDVEGTSFTLVLWPSQVIPENTGSSSADFPDTHYYAGRVLHAQDSWARVSISGDAIQGVVSWQGERYQLTADNLMGTLDYYQPHARNQDDAAKLLDDYVVHPPGSSVDTSSVGTSDFEARNSQPDKSTGTTRIARLALVVDSQYDAYYGNRGLHRALQAVNVADGIFREEFGLGFDVIATRVFNNADADPMNLGPASLEQSLRMFRSYRLLHNDDWADASLVYLFTGNENTDEAIGLAWIGAACRVDGFDVGVTTPSAYSDLLLTHELGHSLGASHDSDTSCADSPDHLMWPRISASTQQSFTQCSNAAVTPRLSADCLVDAVDVELKIDIADAHRFDVVISNNDAVRSVPDTQFSLDRTAVNFQTLPAGCVEASLTDVICNSGYIASGSSHRFQFAIQNELTTNKTLLAEVAPIDIYEANPANNVVELVIGPDGASSLDPESVPQSLPSQGILADADTTQSGGSGGGSVSLLLWLVSSFWLLRVALTNTFPIRSFDIDLRSLRQ